MPEPEYKLITFRCPVVLADRLDLLGEVTHLSRSELLKIIMRVQLRQARKRGGRVTIPYTAHFVKDELEVLLRLAAEREA